MTLLAEMCKTNGSRTEATKSRIEALDASSMGGPKQKHKTNKREESFN